MKLHLGCGTHLIDGWINCDIHKADGVHVVDIRQLPFDNDSADYIMAIHVCEHLYKHDLLPALQEWHRVLKPEGYIAIELPCLDRILSHFVSGSPENLTLHGLFGDPETHIDGEPALHNWCWSKAAFRKQLETAGFKDIQEESPHYHQPSRDMRFVCTK